MNGRSEPFMKTTRLAEILMQAAATLMAAVTLLLASGCFTGRGDDPNQPDPWVNTIEVLAREAALAGASWDLVKHPENRAKYAAAAEGLKALADKGHYDPVAFAAVLDSLAVMQGTNGLAGESGAIVIVGGLAVYGLVAGFIDLTTAPRVAAAMRGTIYGLEKAIAPPPASRGLARPVSLPKQCVVPKR